MAKKEPTPVKRLETMPLSWFRVNANVRKFFSKEKLHELEESLGSEGQLQPLGAYKDGSLYWGQRRLMAAPGAGLTHLDTYVFETPLSDTQVRVFQLTENMQRADLTAFDKWNACTELMCMNAGWQMKDLADHLHLDASTVTRMLSPSRCTPEWQTALQEGKVSISDCYAASKLPAGEAQAELLAMKLAGSNRDELERKVRKVRNGHSDELRATKVKVPFQGRIAVLTGKQLCMSDIVEILEGLLKEARKAAGQFDVKTWAAMMRDKAANGEA